MSTKNQISNDTTFDVVRGKILNVDERLGTINGELATINTVLFKHDNGSTELFESRDNFSFGKYNNAEIISIARYNINKTVVMEVSGKGKTYTGDYRNILTIKLDE